MGSKYKDLYFISKFPKLADELKKVLPEECNLIVVPLSDGVKKWNHGIVLSKDEMDFIKNAEVLVVDCTYLSEMLYKLPNIKWVQTTWAGLELLMDKVDRNKPPNFTLTRYVDSYFGELMSNYAIAQIINIERGFYTYRDKQKKSEWSWPFFPDFRVLSDLTIGIFGAGNLGSAVSGLLRKAGCYVIVFVRSSRSFPTEAYDEASTDLKYVLEKADYLINVLPSSPETRNMLDDDVLQFCKKKPVFINMGRGDIIKEKNIIKALSEGWISKAVLDVFEQEPLAPDSILWSTDEVYITPHVGAIPRIDGIAKFIADNYMKYVNQKPLLNVVDWTKGY